jgi:hypothetical protein
MEETKSQATRNGMEDKRNGRREMLGAQPNNGRLSSSRRCLRERAERDSQFGHVDLWVRNGVCVTPPEGIEARYVAVMVQAWLTQLVHLRRKRKASVTR